MLLRVTFGLGVVVVGSAVAEGPLEVDGPAVAAVPATVPAVVAAAVFFVLAIIVAIKGDFE